MTLTDILATDRTVLLPGAYDALSARLIEQAGFPIAYLGGLGNEASDLGLPDLGFTTATEIARRAGAIASVASVPVFCDADTGFGGTVNVVRTVRLFERAGVSAIHLEDQTFPKRCGVLEGKQAVAPGAFEKTIRAALNSRRNDTFQIVARSDAKGSDGVAGVAERLKRYAGAGAHAVMVGDPYDLSEYERLAEATEVPLIACAMDRDHQHLQPDYHLYDWQSAGVALVLYWHLALFAALHNVRAAIESLNTTGSAAAHADRVAGYRDYAKAVDLDGWIALADE